MPDALHETSTAAATEFAQGLQPALPSAIIAEETACDSVPRCRETQTELAPANWVAILEQLSATIGHEVIQPVGAAVTGAQAALRWLEHQPPDLEEARHALAQIVRDAMRAGESLHGIRALMKKALSRNELLDINENDPRD